MATPGNIFHTITPALGLTAGMRTVSRASAIAGGSQNLNCRIPFHGVVLGVLGSGIVAVFTFVIRRHLSYRRMLVATGVLLGGVLLVMVGEAAQEMQLARWLPTTEIHSLLGTIPPWTGSWLSVFPTVETLSAQGLVCLLVVGSYLLDQMPKARMESVKKEVG